MDWSLIITELGGGLPAVVIVGLVIDRLRMQRRIDALTDKFIDQNGENIASMNNLTSAIRDRRTA
jgi:phage terminase Nu1 subunit (DNA packaging protein)